jgi:hypothetical protein
VSDHAKVSRLPSVEPSTYDEKSHTIDWVLNDGEVDRQGEIVVPGGGKMAPHVNLVDHHLSQPSVDSILGVVVKDSYRLRYKSGVATLRFDQNNPRAFMSEGMVRDGIIGNGSIRFEPLGWFGPGDRKESTRKVGDPSPFGGRGFIWSRWQLLEFSLVGVPANEGALSRMAKAYGLDPERMGFEERDRPEQLVLRYADPDEIDFLEQVAENMKDGLPELRSLTVTLEDLFA